MLCLAHQVKPGRNCDFLKPRRVLRAQLIVEVDTGEYDMEAALAEMYELTRSAGAEPCGAVTQKRPSPDPATYVGSGMMEEIAYFCRTQEIELLIFDCELSPTQLRNIEEAADVRTVDRTMLILDIFASRARSREGKLQVELAQLRYLLPRLTGRGTQLSRLGGGIGTRGPGETKLETDRRHIRRRIGSLKEELALSETSASSIPEGMMAFTVKSAAAYFPSAEVTAEITSAESSIPISSVPFVTAVTRIRRISS